MEYLYILKQVLVYVLTAYWCYQTVISLCSLIKLKDKPYLTNKNHKFMAIVPAHNEEMVVANLIESLKNQTYDKNLYDIYVIADNCTDNTAEVARKAGAIVFERFDPAHKTKGYALQWFLKQKIEENADYVECDFIWEFPNKIRVDKQYPYKNKKEMLSFVRVVAWNKLIKRQLITDNNLEFPKGLRYEDVEFTYKLIPFVNKFAYVDKPFIHYVQREGSIANVQNERTAEIFTVLDNVIEFYKKNNIYEKYRDELEYNYARYLLCSSLKRMCKIKDKSIREKLLTENWERLNSNFPNWKKNVILKTVNIGKNKYMRTVNKSTYKIYSKILEII
mgnify:CR=1 FL=1